MKNILIFTDLDGTLLDHYTYSHTVANDALNRIAGSNIPLVFCSSKTQPEILNLRKEIGNSHPFVLENGGAVIVPQGYFNENGEIDHVQSFGANYEEIVRILANLKKYEGFLFRGFWDFSVNEIAEITGLSLKKSAHAKQRLSSEPLLWDGSTADLTRFQHALEQHKLKVVGGGRFYHVMGMTDKAHAVQWLIDRYQENFPTKEFLTIALGDSPNDEAMLRLADIAVVIKPAKGDTMILDDCVSAIYPEKMGPEGWSEAIQQILDQNN